jgi:hypothetical protein
LRPDDRAGAGAANHPSRIDGSLVPVEDPESVGNRAQAVGRPELPADPARANAVPLTVRPPAALPRSAIPQAFARHFRRNLAPAVAFAMLSPDGYQGSRARGLGRVSPLPTALRDDLDGVRFTPSGGDRAMTWRPSLDAN